MAPMTAKQMMRHVGRRGSLAAGDFTLRVEVVDARDRADHLEYRVAAIEGGTGEAWVASGQVTLDPDDSRQAPLSVPLTLDDEEEAP